MIRGAFRAPRILFIRKTNPCHLIGRPLRGSIL